MLFHFMLFQICTFFQSPTINYYLCLITLILILITNRDNHIICNSKKNICFKSKVRNNKKEEEEKKEKSHWYKYNCERSELKSKQRDFKECTFHLLSVVEEAKEQKKWIEEKIYEEEVETWGRNKRTSLVGGIFKRNLQ